MKKIILILVILLLIGFNSYGQDKEDFCSKIKKEVDEFTDKVEYSTPSLKDGRSSIEIIKTKENDSASYASYYLYIITIGSILTVGGDGVILLLDDKTKIVKPDQEVHVRVTEDYGYKYSSYISLTNEDIEILKSKSIDKFRLYIYDKDLSSVTSNSIQMYIQCLTDK